MIFVYGDCAVQVPDWYGEMFVAGHLVPRSIDNELGVNHDLPYFVVS